MSQLGYGGIANTNGTRDFTGKTLFVPVSAGGRVTNIASHFTKPTEITIWLTPLIPEILRLLGKSKGF